MKLMQQLPTHPWGGGTCRKPDGEVYRFVLGGGGENLYPVYFLGQEICDIFF